MLKMRRLVYIVLVFVIAAHCMTVISYAAKKTVPKIKTNPKNVTITAGKQAKFTVKASGGGLKYQWYYSSNGGKTWNAVSGAAGKKATYKVTAQSNLDGYQYYCKVSNSKGSKRSKAVTLKVIPLIEITSQPEKVITHAGATAVFTVKATGKNLSYVWYYSTNNGKTWAKTAEKGGRSATYSVEVAQARNGYLYFCKITSGKAFVNSTVVSANIMNVRVTGFVRGAITPETGGETASDFTARGEYYLFDHVDVTWRESCKYAYRLIFFDKNYNLCGYTGLMRTSRSFDNRERPSAKYFRFVFESVDQSAIPGKPELPQGCSILSDRGTLKIYHEKPKSQGVLNFLKRVEQGINLQYKVLEDLPQQKGNIKAGTTVRGLVYSSTREEMLFVPNCVSLNTFMTALKNPNSYVYTRTSKLNNSRTYYGNICSGFLSYAYNLNRVSNSAEMVGLPEFTRRKKQDVDHLELGDLLKKQHHVICVYDILRDADGKIVLVRFAQETNPLAFVMGATPARTNTLLSTIYKAYQFNNFSGLTYTESQWVSVRGEGKKDPKWNHCLIPRRGDKANWPLGETVEIDILQKSSFTKAILYKDDTKIKETSIADIQCLSYEGLTNGTYKVCLSNGRSQSGFCYFKVVSSSVRVENLGGGKARIYFSSEDGTPSWYSWSTVDGDSPKFPEKTGNITAAMISNGYVVSSYKTGPWYFRVYFKNEFGTFSSQFVLADISK